jgi:hypothetical protein
MVLVCLGTVPILLGGSLVRYSVALGDVERIGSVGTLE